MARTHNIKNPTRDPPQSLRHGARTVPTLPMMSEDPDQVFDIFEAAFSVERLALGDGGRDDGDGVGSDGGSAASNSSSASTLPLYATPVKRLTLGGCGGGGEEEGHDHGASSAATKPTKVLHTCSHCDLKDSNGALFACVYTKEGFPFARTMDHTYERAKCTADQTFPAQDVAVDTFDNTPVEYMCIYCCSKYHDAELTENNRTYWKNDGRPSSFWYKKANRSKKRIMAESSRRRRSRHRRRRRRRSRHPNNTGVSSIDAYRDMKKDQKKAWRYPETLGGDSPFLWLFHGCSNCKTYPFRDRDWYQVKKKSACRPLQRLSLRGVLRKMVTNDGPI